MGLLTLAGALSGAGNAAKDALMEQGKQQFARSIEQSRQEMETLRQERNLAAQRGMHAETIASQREQGEATRAQAQTLQTERIGAEKETLGTKIEAEKGLAGEKIGAEKEMLGTKLGAEERMLGKKLKTEEGIHKATNDVTLAVARIHAASAKTTAGASNIQVLQKDLADQRHQLSLLEVESNKILTDPDSVSGRRISADIDNARASIAQEHAYLNALLKTPAAPTVKERASFSYPQGMAPSKPGMIDEAAMMRKSIE
jgi:hypothetical protein